MPSLHNDQRVTNATAPNVVKKINASKCFINFNNHFKNTIIFASVKNYLLKQRS